MKKVLISAGHSNTDPGAVAGNIHEADIATLLRNETRAQLLLKGIAAVTDGIGKDNKPLSEAIKLSRSLPSDAIRVEIHLNAGPTAAHGIEALCHTPLKALAQELCAAVKSVTGHPLRGDKGWKDTNSGQHAKLGFCEAGGIILEVGFISNQDERTSLLNNAGAIGAALADVIYKHV